MVAIITINWSFKAVTITTTNITTTIIISLFIFKTNYFPFDFQQQPIIVPLIKHDIDTLVDILMTSILLDTLG